MKPDILTHAQHGHTVKPLRIIKKQVSPFVDNSVIGGVPGNIQMIRNKSSSTMAANAQSIALWESFERGSAALLVSSCQKQPQAQRQRRIRSSNLVGRCP